MKIDALPTQGAGWICDIVTSTGNKYDDDGELLPPEKLELWRRDPVECVCKVVIRGGWDRAPVYAGGRKCG